MKYRVDLTAYASMTITVEVDDDLDEQDAREAAIEKAFEEVPGDLCHQCAGYRQKWSLEIGDWDVAKDPSTGLEYAPEKVND